MKNASSTTAKNKIKEIEPIDKRSVNLAKFTNDIAPKDWAVLLGPSINPSVLPSFLLPIETLSPTKTVGRGRTNTTIIVPTIVQTDAATPNATFDRQAIPVRNPAIQIHFEPSAYGITSKSGYVVEFTIQVFGQGTFTLNGGGGGVVVNPGSKVLSGQTTVSVVFQNVESTQQIFAFVEQTAGARWSWFSTRVSFPPLVATS